MIEPTQADINFHYIRALARKITRLEEDNNALKELIEKLRLYLLAKKREEKLHDTRTNASV